MSTTEDTKCGICDANEQIRSGKFRDFIAELKHSYVILGDAQFYRGYSILFAKHHARELFLISRDEALGLFDEVVSVAEAIDEVVKPVKMNYECLGNSEPHIHWHLFPRYQADRMRRGPVWVRPAAYRRRKLKPADRRDLMRAIRAEIKKRIPHAIVPES